MQKLIFMKILSDFLVNLVEYSECKSISKYDNKIERGKYIDAKLYLDYYEEMLALSKNQYFGLYFGFFLNLKALGSVFEISLTTSSIGQVVSLWSDYSEMNFPLVKFNSYMKNDTFILELDSDLKKASVRNQILDTIFTFVFRELNIMIGNNVDNIYLPYKNFEPYSELFNCNVEYRNKHTFSFDREVLEREINAKNRKRIENLLPNFLKLLNTVENNDFSSLVKQMILNMCNPELPTLKQVSSQFSITERTLQRRLKKENSSFRIITNEIKKTLSNYLRKGNNIKTQDIAFTLGYSSSSSFLHANKQWMNIQKQI